MRPLLSTLVVVVVWLLSQPVSAAGDPETSQELYYRTTLVVVAEEENLRDPARTREEEQVVKDDMVGLLKEHHLVLVDGQGDIGPEVATVTVRLGWRNFEDSHRLVSIDVRRPGGEIASLKTFECYCVYAGEITPHINERLLDVLEMLQRPPPEVAVKIAAKGPVDNGGDTVPTAAKRGPATWAGVGLLTAGTVASVVGGILVGRGSSEVLEAGSSQRGSATDFLRPGSITLGVGLGAIVSGIALIVIDNTVLRKRRASNHLSVVPALNSETAGLWLKGKF